MLPQAWKKEIDDTIGKATERNAEDEKARHEEKDAISAPLRGLANEFVGYKDEQRKTDKGKRCREIATIWGLFVTAGLTLALGVVGIVQSIFFYGQLEEMRKVYDPIQKSAEAAESAAKTARDVMNATERANIIVQKISVINWTQPNSSLIRLRVVLKNAGKANADITEGFIGAIVTEGGAPPPIPPRYPPQRGAPQQVFSIPVVPGLDEAIEVDLTPWDSNFRPFTITSEEITNLVLQKHKLYVYGRLQFSDDFDSRMPRPTYFCRRFVKPREEIPTETVLVRCGLEGYEYPNRNHEH